ncbi:MAG: helix-turn-helix domain-containing protein [Emcibacteraceae bacterium]
MERTIRKRYNMGGYSEYDLVNPDHMIEAMWVQKTPLSAPIGGIHHLVPETTVNIAISRLVNTRGSASSVAAFVFGPLNKPFTFKLVPGHQIMAARIKPEWISNLIGISSEELFNKIVDLRDISHTLNDQLLSILDQTSSEIEIIQKLYHILKNHHGLKSEKYKLSDYGKSAIELIRKSNGHISQSQLTNYFNISDRHLRRTVSDLTGFSPKALCRNIRFLRTLEYSDRSSKIDWADCAVKFGYYDQAHLINEFKMLTHLTPNQLMQTRKAESVFSNSAL